MSEATSYQCRHIFTEGRQCGSPALRREQFCFYHHASRRPAACETFHGVAFLNLPAPEDLHAVQRGLCEIFRLTAGNYIEDRHAAVLIRCLSIASANLARIARQQKNAPAPTELVQDFVHDPVLGSLAVDTASEPEPETLRSPQNDTHAYADARWDKAVAERAAYTARTLRQAEPNEAIPDVIPPPCPPAESRAPTPPPCHPSRSGGPASFPSPTLNPTLEVQTYLPSNEDFGLLKKTRNMSQSPQKNTQAHANANAGSLRE